jgi:hypothetical protein
MLKLHAKPGFTAEVANRGRERFKISRELAQIGLERRETNKFARLGILPHEVEDYYSLRKKCKFSSVEAAKIIIDSRRAS